MEKERWRSRSRKRKRKARKNSSLEKTIKGRRYCAVIMACMHSSVAKFGMRDEGNKGKDCEDCAVYGLLFSFRKSTFRRRPRMIGRVQLPHRIRGN